MKTIKIVNQQKRGLNLLLSIERNNLVFFSNWLPSLTLVVSNIIAGRQTKCQILWHVYGLTQGVMIAFGQRIDLFTRRKAMTSNNKNPKGAGTDHWYETDGRRAGNQYKLECCAVIITFHGIDIDVKDNAVGNLFVIDDVFVIIIDTRILDLSYGAVNLVFFSSSNVFLYAPVS